MCFADGTWAGRAPHYLDINPCLSPFVSRSALLINIRVYTRGIYTALCLLRSPDSYFWPTKIMKRNIFKEPPPPFLNYTYDGNKVDVILSNKKITQI